MSFLMLLLAQLVEGLVGGGQVGRELDGLLAAARHEPEHDEQGDQDGERGLARRMSS